VVDAAANLGDYEKLVAEFWADGADMAMPPGHWTHIACEAARAEVRSAAIAAARM
jgi:hypothetical protein